MKKFLRVFMIIIVACTLVAGLVACQSSTSTPKNLKITGDTVSWDENTKADKYGVVVGDTEEAFTKNTFYNIVVDTIGDYKVKVRSYDESGKVGSFSKEITYTKTKRLSSPNVYLSDDQKLLKWDAVPNATKYKILAKHEEKDENVTKTYDATTTEFKLEGDDFATPAYYYLTVTAIGDGKNYYDSLTSESKMKIVSTVLDTPAEFKLGDKRVTWQTVTNAQKYRISIEGIEGDATGLKPNDYIVSGGSTTYVDIVNNGEFVKLITKPGKYNVKISAFYENSKIFLESQQSSVLVIEKLKAPTNAQIVGDEMIWQNNAVGVRTKITPITSTNSSGVTIPVTDENAVSYRYADNETLYGEAYGGRIYSFEIYSEAKSSNTVDGEIVYLGQMNSDKVAVKDASATKTAEVYTYNKTLEAKDGIYELKSPADIAFVYYNAHNSYKYKVIKEIDFGGYEILPIGTLNATGFAGEFDGDGKTLTNFVIKTFTGTQIGLFSVINSGASVKNLKVMEVAIFSNTEKTFAGALAAVNEGTIEFCAVSGKVQAIKGSAGGLVAVNNSTISNCASNIYVEAAFKAGGLVSSNGGKIGGSSSYGEVRAAFTKELAIAGITTYKVWAGGLVGENASGSEIINSFSLSYVSGNISYNVATTLFVGGFVGENAGKVENSYARGSKTNAAVSLIDDNNQPIPYESFIAGFTGNNSGNIKDAYTLSPVNSSSNTVAGFVHTNSGRIENAFTSDATIMGRERFAFAYENKSGGSIINCYFNNQTNVVQGQTIKGIKTNGAAEADVSIASKDKAGFKSTELTTALGAGFVYNANITNNNNVPALAKMFYFAGTQGATNTTFSYQSTPIKPNFTTYFGMDKVEEVEIDISGKKKYYAYFYSKTIDTTTYSLARFYKVNS